jgi:1-deoxy-D-xylulose-5-phosphate reductoisomerase
MLAKQAAQLGPEHVCVGKEEDAASLRRKFPSKKIYYGIDGLKKLASLPEADAVLIAVVGAVGIYPLVAALCAGKRVALANKESLVIAGGLIRKMLDTGKGEIIPVDSEHSALFQCLIGEDPASVNRLIITGSGGPFYGRKTGFGGITPSQALKHPNWKMGKKITVDSATLMNKGLEVIEASALFNVPLEKIEILIHPQSIVHSMVEFKDHTVKAVLSVPDMRLAIQYALAYPERPPSKVKTLDLVKAGPLDFSKPDFRKFPCLALAISAAAAGGTMPAVLNASNEIAVEAFLKGKIKFTEIPVIISRVMRKNENIEEPSLDDVLAADAWARMEAQTPC